MPAEYPLLREGQVVYTYLHLAPAPELTKAMLERKVVGIAYETSSWTTVRSRCSHP
jgi:alanine dehydrogenase